LSFSFWISTGSPPTIDTLFDGLDELRCSETLPGAGELPEGYFHVYRWGVSTRGIELCRDGGSLKVRILTCSAPEEIEIALRIASNAARWAGAPIEPEIGAACSADELADAHGPAWVSLMAESGARSLAELTRRQGAVLKLMGPVRTFHIGPRTLDELDRGGPDAELGARLYEIMRRVQYVDPAQVFISGKLTVGTGSGAPLEMSVWGPDADYLFSDVEYLCLAAGEPSDVLVPKSTLPALAGERCDFLDDVHVLVRAVRAAEWPSFVDRARRHQVPFPAP
jgi:hypothetical protein